MHNKSILEKPVKTAKTEDISTPDDGEVHLTPKESSTGARGTIFFSSADDCVYVATGA
jgi:hypothetical protein